MELRPGIEVGDDVLAMAAMELELEQILGRTVDLRTYGDLSRYLRDRVRASARDLYAA